MKEDHDAGARILLTAGAPLGEAQAALILCHGRGSTAEDILGLAAEIEIPGFAFIAPQAPGGVWYPNSFLRPAEENEPWLSRSLNVVAALIREARQAGLPADRVMLAGFSQGACLALECAARNPGRMGGIVGLSGGLMGPPGSLWSGPGDYQGTPVFLGCSANDPFIPRSRVEESAGFFRARNARVTVRLYPGNLHGVEQDELNVFRGMMMEVVGASRPRS